MNLIPARVDGGALVAGPFRFPLRVPSSSRPLPSRLEVGVRPEHVRCAVDPAGPAGEGAPGPPGEVVAVEPLGAETHLVVRVGDLELRAVARGWDAPSRGDTVHIAIDEARAILFSAEGDGERVA